MNQNFKTYTSWFALHIVMILLLVTMILMMVRSTIAENIESRHKEFMNELTHIQQQIEDLASD